MAQHTDFLGQHPIVGLSITALHIGGAFLLQATHLPPIVMELFQVGAWSVAMLAGSFTVYGVIKTHHGKKKR